jgi:hypothetical protein
MRPESPASRTLICAGLLAFAIATLAGCSQLPTAPVTSQQPAGVSSLSPDQGSTELPSVVPTTTTVDPGVQPPAAESSRWLSPLLGGTVTAGQFKVVVPPGALRQRALVTVRQPRLDQRLVQLEVSPASANGFLVPVLLIANCSDMDTKLLSLQTIWWWNPVAQHWEAVLGVQINLLGRTLTAPLWHFSTYQVGGKAGW